MNTPKRFKTLCGTVLAALLAVMSAAAASAAYEPYTLSYNSTYAGSHEGIQAGWTLDNRGGLLRTTIHGGYDMLKDTSTLRGSSLYRDLNLMEEGVATLETSLVFREGFDGLKLILTDADGNVTYQLETDDGAFYLSETNGRRKIFTPQDTAARIHVLVTLDFETGRAHTVLADTDCGDSDLLSDNIRRFAFTTTPEDTLTLVPSGLKLVANYTLHDDFTYYTGSAKQIPYGWESSGAANAYVQNTVGYAANGAYMKKSFSQTSGKQSFDFCFLSGAGSRNLVDLSAGQTAVLSFSMQNGEFRCNDQTVYASMLDNFWYRVRAEIDFDKSRALIKLNGRKMAEVPLKMVTDGVDGICFTGFQNGFRFDDIRLAAMVDEADYVPEPVIPNDSKNNIVGMNVCSLWAYTSNHGWSCVTPYDEVRPVLGYYDEGSAETADWEIKFLTEHGVDFQAFCWYADNRNAPLKTTRNSIHLHDGFMNARYSDKMKYCIIWEAANGAHPENSNAFRSYFVPFWIENYFKDDRYMVIDNKPVLLVFGINHFINDMGSNAACKAELDYLRNEVKKLGFDDLIILASNAWDSKSLADAGLDGCYAYNWGTSGYDVDYSIGRITSCAAVGATYTVPTISTGFNSLPWHGKRYPNMSVSDYERGLMWVRDTYFETYPKKEWQKRFMMLSTWNEYGEGTYIMPAEKLNGFGYLDTIRKVFTDDDAVHNDVIPTENQLSRITKNYPQHVRLLRRLDREKNDPEETLFPVQTVSFDNPLLYTVSGATGVSYNGGLSGIASSEKASYLTYIESRDTVGLNFAALNALRITMSVSEDTEVNVYYTTTVNRDYDNKRKLTFTATVGGMKTYILETGSDKGILDKIRIFPADHTGVRFSVCSLEGLGASKLFSDGKELTSAVLPVIRDGNIYYPFDPSIAEGYILNLHFEWDYASKTLTFYGDDGRSIAYTVGSDKAVTELGTVSLPCEVFTVDGLPMLYMPSFCEALGFDCHVENNYFYIYTQNYEDNSYLFTRPENEWDFTHGHTLGWTMNATYYNTGDSLYVKATDNDTRMRSGKIAINSTAYSEVEVCLSFDSTRPGTESLQCFFITENDSTWTESKSVRLLYESKSTNGAFKTYRLRMTDCLLWKDTITEIRIDPFNATDSEGYIKYIRLIPSGKKPDEAVSFTGLAADAEDGECPFYSDNAEVTIVPDPTDASNHVFRVVPTSAGTYTHFVYDIVYEPGASYTVSFDVMAGSLAGGDTETQQKTYIHVDPRYDDPKQYPNERNNYDHVLNATSPASYSNSGQWRHTERTFTVPQYSFIRNMDLLWIYANPVDGRALEFYVDNVVITKNTQKSLSVDYASADTSGTVAVTGSTGQALPAGTTLITALYDTAGRFLTLGMPEVSSTGSYSIRFDNMTSAKTVKVYLWSGFRTLRPRSAEVTKNIG